MSYYILKVHIDTNEEFSYDLSKLGLESDNDTYEFKATDRNDLNPVMMGILDCLQKTIKVEMPDKSFLPLYIKDFKDSTASIKAYLSKVKTFSYTLSFGSSAISLKMIHSKESDIMNNGLYHIQDNKIYKMSLNEPMKQIGVVASINDRNNLIDGFANELINKIESKYCQGDLTSQYIGMQTCEWIKEIAETMKQ